jgi:hypothetical protein
MVVEHMSIDVVVDFDSKTFDGYVNLNVRSIKEDL